MPPELSHFRGLLVEPSNEANTLTNTYDPTYTTVSRKGFDPHNAESELDRLKAPLNIDLVKYDTDGADCDVIEAMLKSKYDVKLFQIEFNIVYVPPIKLNLYYDERYIWGLLNGDDREYVFPQLTNECSLQYLVDMMESYGYYLLQLIFWDAWFV
eukprot:UN34034